jgi:hypothetical protein
VRDADTTATGPAIDHAGPIGMPTITSLKRGG